MKRLNAANALLTTDWINKDLPPLLLTFITEAHNMCNDTSSESTPVKKRMSDWRGVNSKQPLKISRTVMHRDVHTKFDMSVVQQRHFFSQVFFIICHIFHYFLSFVTFFIICHIFNYLSYF